MIDILLGVAIAFLLLRGWFRGFVREAMDLVGLIAGIILSFRLSPLVGDVISDMAAISRDISRFIAGIFVFIVVGIGAAFIARALERKARMPGLNLINRAWGAGLAGLWGLFIATLALSLLVLAPVPSAVSSQLNESTASRTLTDPGGLPQRVFTRLAGDRILQTLLNLREAIGSDRVVIEGEEALTFHGVDAAGVKEAPDAAAEIYDLLNRARVDAGIAPLAWSDALAEVGERHAEDMYASGVFSHRSPSTGLLSDRLSAAGIFYRVAGENLALAVTTSEIHRGLMASDGHRANVLAGDFRRVGVAALDGPYGLMTVQVFTG